MKRKSAGSASASAKPKRRFQHRARQSEDKQRLLQKFIDIARDKFAVQDVEDVSLTSIAAEAGYSKGTLYQYFPSRIALLIAVKEQSLREITEKMLAIVARTPEPRLRLTKVIDAYVRHWVRHPSNFKSLYSMSGTVEDRRMPDGTLFGESYVAQRAFDVFRDCVSGYFASRGAEFAPELVRLLASALLSAAHGAVAQVFGTPSMKWPDITLMGRLSAEAILHSWDVRLAEARRGPAWPRLDQSIFLPDIDAGVRRGAAAS
jgi:AcrR family transcriptional regulator